MSAERAASSFETRALHAEKIGLNSDWIGEHHFHLLGVNDIPKNMTAQNLTSKSILTGPPQKS